MTTVQVDDLIASIDYDSLIQLGLIPDLDAHSPDLLKKYPAWVYRQAKQEEEQNKGRDKKKHHQVVPAFDKTMRMLVRQMIQGISLSISDPGMFSKPEWSSYMPTLQTMSKTLVEQWQSYGAALDGKMTFDHKIATSTQIEGSPDIITPKAVLGIRTTTRFTKISKSTYLEMLMHFSLLKRESRSEIRYLGVVLPMQMQILVFDLETWEDSPFFDYMVKKAQFFFPTIPYQLKLKRTPQELVVAAGHHFRVRGSLRETLMGYLQHYQHRKIKPGIQIMIDHHVPHSSDDIAETRALILAMNIPLFVHTPFGVNLSSPTCDLRPFLEDLQTTHALGGRGVVVHVGAATTTTRETGIQNMKANLEKCLPFATEQCPILLETSAGEGNDVTKRIEQFSEFYSMFTEEQHKRFKICIDTCHIHTAGHDPYEYLLQWASRHSSDSIGLVHYNDSASERGACHDHHAALGEGTIGLELMLQIADWCLDQNIAMVYEC